MPLENGDYEIRFVPTGIRFPFLGGVYATSGDINKPVRAVALNPEAHGKQKWNVRAVTDKPDTYIITLAVPPGYIGIKAGFGLGGKHKAHREPVVLEADIVEWVITLVDAENSVYRIAEPANGSVGAIHAVAEEDSHLLVRSYPVIRDMPPLPQWQFIGEVTIKK